MSLKLRKATKARHVSEVSLNRGLERSLREAVKFPKRPQDGGDPRAVEPLLSRAANRSGSPGERTVLQSTKLEGIREL